jgi:hypothetical protein
MARTDTASRVIAAPLDRVYAALVDPEALTAWLPPDGMSGRFERFDARPGGSYRLVLTYGDALSACGKATADSDIVEARLSTWSLVCGWCRLSTSFRRPDPRWHYDNELGGHRTRRQPRHLPRAVTEAATTEVLASVRAAGLSVPHRGRLPDATPTRPTRSARKRNAQRGARYGLKIHWLEGPVCGLILAL